MSAARLTDVEVDAFARGHMAGIVSARLEQHDRHFETINGSIERYATELGLIRLALQRLADQADAAVKTAAAAAAAVKEADELRRTTAESKFAPWSRIAVIVGAMAAVVGAGTAYLTFKQPTEVRIVRPDVTAPAK